MGPIPLLPPIIAEGSPADVLNLDPIVPAIEGSTTSSDSSGTLQNSLRPALPFPIVGGGKAGSQTSVLGVGRSSQETAVQAFGVPLNPPQGGGFDLSTFPQYLLAGYQFQLGPSLGAFDPHAVAGTLTLVPWTEQALSDPSSRARLTQFYSSEGITQVSLGGRWNDQAAVAAGFSDGRVRGPGASLSGRWGDPQGVHGKYHLLAMQTKTVTSGSLSFPTPDARQVSTRVLPVFQADIPLKNGTLLKSSVFYEGTHLNYDDPGEPGSSTHLPFSTREQVRQAGMENALLWEDWKFGLSARQLTYQSLIFRAPTETIVNFQSTKSMEWGPTTVEPTLQLTGVSQMGVWPTASLGARREWRERSPEVNSISSGSRIFSTFARLSYSRRLPSLVERYYEMPGFFTGNPDLKSERDWTALLGVEKKEKTWETTLQGYGQYRDDSILAVGVPSPVNLGSASIFALTHTAQLRPAPLFHLTHSLTWTSSKVSAMGAPFPYLSDFIGLLSTKILFGKVLFAKVSPWAGQFESNNPGSFEVSFRYASGAIADPTGSTRVSGYGVLDLGFQCRLLSYGEGGIGSGSGRKTGPSLDWTGRVENVLDRPIELVRDYPSPGRVFSMAIMGEF